jgi:hypothetical protein
MKKLTAWLFVLLLFFNLIPVFMPVVNASPSMWYVATAADGGSDSNSGVDIAHPFLTLQKAINHSANSDIIYMRRGDYTYHHLISVNRSGTASNYFTIMNYNGEHPKINGLDIPHYNYLNSTIEIKTGNYIRLSGLNINHSYMGGITIRPSRTYIRIDNCTIGNCSSFAFKVVSGSYIYLENNYIYNNQNNWSAIGGEDGISEECISIEATSHFYIVNNSLYNNHQEQIDIKGGCSWGYIHHNRINNTATYKVYKNPLWYWGDTGIYLDARGKQHNISIYNNLIYGNNSGITINNEGGTGHHENISIYNNVINITNPGNKVDRFDGLMGITVYRGDDSPISTEVTKDIKIYMNTIVLGVNNDFPGLRIGLSSYHMDKNFVRRLSISNNIFTENSIDSDRPTIDINGLNSTDSTTYISLNNNLYNNSYPGARVTIKWQEATYYSSSPTKWGNNPIFTKPLYITILPADFHLNNTSPCIGAATSSLVASTDYDGVTRPQGGTYDIGAYEYVTSSGDTTPPQISNIVLHISTQLDTDIGWENFTCSATDNIEVSSVVLKLTNPNQSTTNIPMVKKTGTTTYYSNQSLHIQANYSYRIQATDTSNNDALSSSYPFSLTPNWDIDSNGFGSILDLVLISNQYGETGESGWIREDVDNNGAINVLDLNLVSDYYGVEWYS